MKVPHPLFRACFWLAFGAAAPALAGEPQPAFAGPAAAGLAVPATRYQPVLPYRPAAPGTTSPDQNWKALNRTVGSYNSMALTMDGMEDPEPPQPEPGEQAARPAAGVEAREASAPAHHHHEASQ